MADALAPADFCTHVVELHSNAKYPLLDLISQTQRQPTEEADSAKWDELVVSRTKAGFNSHDADPGQQANRIRKTNTTGLAYVCEEKVIKASTIRMLRKPGQETERWGEDALVKELDDLTDICKRTAEYMLATILKTGAVSSTSPVWSVDFGQASGHTPTAGTSWADASADIIGDLLTWGGLIEDDWGGDCTDILVSRANYKNMIANTAVRELVRAQGGLALLESGTLPDILGMSIRKYTSGYASSQGGSLTRLLDDGHIIMIPDPKEDWWGYYDGDPNDLDAPPNHRGPYAKTYKSKNGKRYHAQLSWQFLGVLRANGAVVYADTTP